MEHDFDVQMDVGTLYDYSLYHTYTSLSGIVGTFVGILLIMTFAKEHSPLYLIFGIVVIFYLPVTLFLACKRQMLAVEAYKKPLHYHISDAGIEVSQGEQQMGHGWDAVLKVVGTRKSVILYTGRNVASIFPRKAMGDQTVPVIQTICKNVDPKRVKLRY